MYDEFAAQRERWDAVNDLWSPGLTNTIGCMQRGTNFFVTLLCREVLMVAWKLII